MKFGSITNPTNSILKEIETISSLGFDYAEIDIEEPLARVDELMKNKNEIIKLLESKDMFALAHAPWWAELGTMHELIRNAWVEEAKNIIRVAGVLGARKLSFHSHSRGLALSNKESKKQVLDNYVNSLRELSAFGKKHNIIIMLENTPEPREISEFKDFKYIVNKSSVLINLDIAHAFVVGGMDMVEKYIKTFKKRIMHVHFSDNDGMSDLHLPLGAGVIDYEKVVKLLKEVGYDKEEDTITLEIFSRDRDLAQNSMLKLKRLF